MNVETWRSDLEAARAAKEEFLREDPNSPIPADRQVEFDGLEFYPPNPDLRFELRLTSFGEPEDVEVDTTEEGSQSYQRMGQFRFEIDGSPYTLSAFRGDPDEESLWVPFKDETNGDTTYPAGRYLDLEPDDQIEGGAWVLDFNRAYSPFCAFSEAYECPLVPPENRLAVRIEAGEKAP
jgi:uncharacterized protein (DUF1684 family)